MSFSWAVFVLIVGAIALLVMPGKQTIIGAFIVLAVYSYAQTKKAV